MGVGSSQVEKEVEGDLPDTGCARGLEDGGLVRGAGEFGCYGEYGGRLWGFSDYNLNNYRI